MLNVPHKAMEKSRLDVLGKLAPYMEKKIKLDPYLTLHPRRAQWIPHPTEEGEPGRQGRGGPWGPQPVHGKGSPVELQKTKVNDSSASKLRIFVLLTKQRARGKGIHNLHKELTSRMHTVLIYISTVHKQPLESHRIKKEQSHRKISKG